MANNCSTEYTFYSKNRNELLELHNKFSRFLDGNEKGRYRALQEQFLIPEKDMVKNACGALCYVAEICMLDGYSDLYGFTLYADDAWNAYPEVFENIINDRFPDVHFSYLAEEFGCGYAVVFNSHVSIYPYTYVISAGIESCDSIMEDEAYKRFQSEDDCRKFVYQLVTEVCEKNGVSHNEISNDSSLDELEEFANDNLPGDDFLNVYKYDLL